MKTWALMLGAMIILSPVQASIKSDLIIGTGLILNGVAFQVLQNQQSDKASDLDMQGQTHANVAGSALLNSAFFDGAAEWELILNGQTFNYFSFLSQARNSEAFGISEGNTAIGLFNESRDHRDTENLYKGVSLTSYAVGGVMVLKGGIAWLLRHRAPTVATVLDGVQIQTARLGGIATYSYRF